MCPLTLYTMSGESYGSGGIVPSLVNLGMCTKSKRETLAPENNSILSQLDLDVLINILKRTYSNAKDVMKYCEVNQQSAALCNNEEFWKLMCYEWKFEGSGSNTLGPWHRTKFTQTLGCLLYTSPSPRDS